MSDSMGTREASEKWGYPQSTISEWCRKGLILMLTKIKREARGISPKMQNVLNP